MSIKTERSYSFQFEKEQERSNLFYKEISIKLALNVAVQTDRTVLFRSTLVFVG